MDWSVMLDCILKAVGSLAATLVITLGSILFSKLSSKIKDSKISKFALEAVKAAEQLYPNTGIKMGKQKYEYVLKTMLAKFPKLTDNEHLKTIIEAAVYKVSEEVKLIAKEQKANTIIITEEKSEPIVKSF